MAVTRKASAPWEAPALPARLPNGDPVLATRVRPPRPPDTFLRRARLVHRMDQSVRQPVTLVNGPAGAGKTLLVADWLTCGRVPGPVGWLTLEAADNQPGNFWAYVREALRAGVPGPPDELAVPAEAGYVDPSQLLRLASWINGQPEPLVLVLDEFEHIDDPGLTAQLHDLVRHTAGRLRLVLVGRNEPLLPLHRYRAAGELAEIRAADLALDRAETAAVLERHGLLPSAATAEAVQRTLSGWTAGVRLLALAAQRADDPDTYLKRIDAEHAAVSDFLLAEVLRTQPEPTQDLLLRCSILGRVHPDLADALTGRRDARRILGRLHQENAFTEALTDGWYRLHPMFAGILRLHLNASDPDRVEELQVRAAHWLAEHGQYRTALDHAAEGGAWDLAAELLVDQLALGELVAGREAARLCDLFARMPTDASTPAAELVRAAVRLARDDAGAALRILEEVEPQLPPHRTALQLAAAFVRTGAARAVGSAALADRAARRAHELGSQAPAELLDRHPELLTLVDADLGSALLWQGRLDEAGRALGAAAQAPPSPTTARLRDDSLCRLALIDYLRGWPGRAERRVREADEAAERSSLAPDSRTDVRHLVLAATALEHEELADARTELNRMTRHPAPGRDPVVVLGNLLIRAKLHLAQGHPDAALRVLEESRRPELLGHPSDWSRERVAVTAAAAHLAAGRPQEAVAALADAPTRAPDSVVTAAQARLCAGQDPAATLRRLHALRDDPAVGTAPRTRALLLLAQADPDPDGPDGTRLLAQALGTAEPERLRRPFRESAAWVRRQLHRQPQLARAHPWLPGDLRPASPAAAPDAEVPPPAEPLTEREREVLVCAAGMLSTQEIADRLFLSPNTVKTHLKNINRKLLTGNRREAVRRAERLHLLGDG
ncbi:LuxR C-terminal-related transcriptional regulator [Kitasatospora sp. NPDC058965]|uniref:helix-turn-helix transcriptional regulator n=1 Tax=Kitasatospora sp. NPDC058965 TaxID=3346682 RepID=UPI0036BFBD4B